MTSLIEQLGGYTEAKKIQSNIVFPVLGYDLLGLSYIHKQCEHAPTRYCEQSNSWCEDYQVSDLITSESVGKALLEYRRKNGIFEVGDGVSHPIFSSIFTIDKVQSYSVLATTNTGYHTSLKTELIRHATDKEIAQGYRDE
ncbi:MAG: hypothetical protein RSE18_12010 [Acinetobacter sp.]